LCAFANYSTVTGDFGVAKQVKLGTVPEPNSSVANKRQRKNIPMEDIVLCGSPLWMAP
jgi:hypothetical protein